MSHLDLMRLMQRAFRRAGVVLHHSQGFTPHAYVSMLLPLSVGMESVCELMEYELDGELAVTPEALNAVLPEGVRVLEVYESTRKARELRRLRALLTLEYDGAVPEPAAITTLLERPELVVEKRTKRGMAETDIRPMLHAYHVEAAPGALLLTCEVSAQEPSLNPMLLAAAINELGYSATKGGINAFTKALAKELAPSNIQVNAVACGAIDTEMNQWMEEDELIALVDEIPAGRLGKAEEVADLAYHLGYKESYLTGQIIGLDGGWI